jgi:hypothetical protein
MTTSTRPPSKLVAPTDVRDEVRVRYAERARAMLDVIEPTASPSATTACCSPANESASCSCGTGYAANDVALLPAAVAETSLGCGDPITIAHSIRIGSSSQGVCGGDHVDRLKFWR